MNLILRISEIVIELLVDILESETVILELMLIFNENILDR